MKAVAASEPYPDSNMTTDRIATILEPRRKHFGNTEERTKDRVKTVIEDCIKRKVR